MEPKGRIFFEKINSQSLSSPLEFTVYLPPCYSKSRQQAYPVLYMLHGQSNKNDQWPRLGLLDAADKLIRTGEITPLIIVMPYEITWSVGPDKSKFGETLVEELFPYIEGTYNACNARECRAIGGLSRGGNWAVNLGFAHTELFTAAGSHSAPLFFGEVNRITSIVTGGEKGERLPRFYVDAGNSDENLTQVLAFVALLKKYDVPYVYTQFTGYHSEDYWRAHVRDYLTWYASQLFTTP
jgi:enterochelin esterase-like enzyme